jgi:hypothetical protein
LNDAILSENIVKIINVKIQRLFNNFGFALKVYKFKNQPFSIPCNSSVFNDLSFLTTKALGTSPCLLSGIPITAAS